jgi:tRNA-dihydrouridine synthase
VAISVIVNGDVKSAGDAERALRETGCAGVMIGRRAIEHPWIFREVRARLDRGATHPPPTIPERLACCRDHLLALREEKHEHAALRAAKRYHGGYLKGVPGGKSLARQLAESRSIAEALEHLANAEVGLAA